MTETDIDITRSIEGDSSPGSRHPAVESPCLIVGLTGDRPTAPGARVFLDDSGDVVLGRAAQAGVHQLETGTRIDIVDTALSRRHAAIRYMQGAWEIEDLQSKNGTIVGGERFSRTTLVDGDVIEVGSTTLIFRERRAAADKIMHRPNVGVSGSSAILFRTFNFQIERIASDLQAIAHTTLPVLVGGDTGTGKELVARTIHDLSSRPGPFVAFNCGALTRSLFESELFGYRRGAFSGAVEDRSGLVRQAHQGTLFLDEVAELSVESQSALLRVLQEGEVRPVGGTVPIEVDVRVLAATHQDLRARIVEGRFRPDLYARLAGHVVSLPPLRERIEDLGLLIATILERVGPVAARVTFHRSSTRALYAYSYPGNIRELDQAIRASIALASGGEVLLEHLPEQVRLHVAETHLPLRPEDRVLRQRLLEILIETKGNVAAAARVLNKAPIQIRRWCRRLSIDLAQFRP